MNHITKLVEALERLSMEYHHILRALGCSELSIQSRSEMLLATTALAAYRAHEQSDTKTKSAAAITGLAITEYLNECSGRERWPWREKVEEIFRANFAPLCPLRPEQPAQPDWIPVSERLPEEGCRVIAARPSCVREMTFKPHEFGDFAYVHGNSSWHYKDVTHWQPLPPPPQTEKSVMQYNVCKTCLAADGRAGNLINGECRNCHDTRRSGKACIHWALNRSQDELNRTLAILTPPQTEGKSQRMSDREWAALPADQREENP